MDKRLLILKKVDFIPWTFFCPFYSLQFWSSCSSACDTSYHNDVCILLGIWEQQPFGEECILGNMQEPVGYHNLEHKMGWLQLQVEYILGYKLGQLQHHTQEHKLGEQERVVECILKHRLEQGVHHILANRLVQQPLVE